MCGKAFSNSMDLLHEEHWMSGIGRMISHPSITSRFVFTDDLYLLLIKDCFKGEKLSEAHFEPLRV